MGNGEYVFRCQWPECVFFASRRIRRGEDMKFLEVCPHHAAQFAAMTNAEAGDISVRRSPQRKISVGPAGFKAGWTGLH